MTTAHLLQGALGGFGVLRGGISRAADLLHERAGAHRADPHLLAQRLGGDGPMMPEAVRLVDPACLGQLLVQPSRACPAHLPGTWPAGAVGLGPEVWAVQGWGEGRGLSPVAGKTPSTTSLPSAKSQVVPARFCM
jgi:hypothetical protein